MKEWIILIISMLIAVVIALSAAVVSIYFTEWSRWENGLLAGVVALLFNMAVSDFLRNRYGITSQNAKNVGE